MKVLIYLFLFEVRYLITFVKVPDVLSQFELFRDCVGESRIETVEGGRGFYRSLTQMHFGNVVVG